jgi:predicted unusual protein kinase regulating ubiquinone biosynthesis (AarF/ABC1/UbiB family)
MRTLDPSLIPTRLVEQSEFLVVPEPPLEKPQRLWFFRMLGQFLTWLLPTLWLATWGKLSPEEFSTRLRVYLEEMGGPWIKAGQLLSLGRDLFPPSSARSY